LTGESGIIVDSIIKLCIATVFGAVVGLEREIHGRPAGLRTNALVCMASCLLIVVSRTGAVTGLDRSMNFVLNVDPARMAAGIVTGIGFLGAGAILRVRESFVRGLTTAAGIWFVAALGIAVGIGAYAVSGAALVLGLAVLILMTHVERRIADVAYRTLIVDIDKNELESVEKSLDVLLKKWSILVHQEEYRIDNERSRVKISIAIRIRTGKNRTTFVSEAAAMPGVHSISWE
jgi:putative Mg2+ transporter-C (MgtC) family protein